MTVLAFDLGATSGKAVAGHIDGQQLAVREIYRFANDPVRVRGRLHWDILRLLFEIESGVHVALRDDANAIESMAIDSWGLDFGLLDEYGELIGNPYHYRDEQFPVAMATALQVVPRVEIFSRTGVQFMPINTLYQLFALAHTNPAALSRAATLLMIPDLLRYFLTGEANSEATNASTTQFLSIDTGCWDTALLEELNLPSRILAPIVAPATFGGHLQPDIAERFGISSIPVVNVASHDTASAVAAVPATSHFAYLSCGTWSLLGTELSTPILSEQALAWNFTNEGGVGSTFRLLKNIMGLWLVEGCRQVWEREGTWHGYQMIAAAAHDAPSFRALIDPDDPRFLNPAHMPNAIAAFCLETDQEVPRTPGETMRCILESLALTYRLVLERTEILSGLRFSSLHVVGGGIQNETLMQFTANAIGRPVLAGPMEATAIGNILVQLMASGQIANLEEGRSLVRDSFPPRMYEPQQLDEWTDAYTRFLAVRRS